MVIPYEGNSQSWLSLEVRRFQLIIMKTLRQQIVVHPLPCQWLFWERLLVPFEVRGKGIRYAVLEQPLLLSLPQPILLRGGEC